MEMFNREVDTYEGLFEKRREINELFRYIKDEEFLNMVMDVVTKQYNTILMEQQDVNTYNDLIVERERKMEALSEINEENRSERFQEVLEQLIKNEEVRQARILEEQRKIEEEEKKKKLEIERKKREEILKRQKIIEEARKKEMEKRTKLLLEQQQNSVLQTNKKDKGISFENIKDISNKENLEDKKVLPTLDEEKKVEKEEFVTFKNKIDIEKELFDEFNNVNETLDDSINKDLPEESIDDKKFAKGLVAMARYAGLEEGKIKDWVRCEVQKRREYTLNNFGKKEIVLPKEKKEYIAVFEF
jgi:hypothetical protein